MRTWFIGFFLSAVVAAAAFPAIGQRVVRIRFARGATGAVIAGALNGFRDSRTFVIRVRAGQTLRTSQVGNSHPITIYIVDPRGEGVGESDASCNDRREITPTIAGDYKIRVVECQKADPWRGRFRFRVTVR